MERVVLMSWGTQLVGCDFGEIPPNGKWFHMHPIVHRRKVHWAPASYQRGAQIAPAFEEGENA